MQTFKLICQATVFQTVREFTNAAGIKCIYGITPDGKRQTVARIADVEFV